MRPITVIHPNRVRRTSNLRVQQKEEWLPAENRARSLMAKVGFSPVSRMVYTPLGISFAWIFGDVIRSKQSPYYRAAAIVDRRALDCYTR